MALTVINKPLGHKLTGIDLEANIYNDGTGTAIVYTGISHGLSDGDYVYIQSDFDAYNGYKYVDSISYDYFKIRESETGDYVQYVQDAEIDYQVSILDHGFLAVHQPIVYEIESTLSPTNSEEEEYNPNVVDSFADSNGNTQVNLDHPLSDATELAKIEFVGEGPLAGVYQILDVLQPWSVVIDLAYDITNDLSGYVIVKYYDNYAINVNVYAGLSATHRWQARKPYELAATLKFIPDTNNKTKFSIAEILRSYINNRNNLTLDTLPNNLDFITGFYIEYFETYDESNGEDITTFEGNVTVDDFTGYSVNAKLEFKNESVSHMSEYLPAEPYTGKWLTLFDRPLALVDHFFDLSFLNRFDGVDITVTIFKSLEGSVTDTEALTITNPGIGVIRVPLTISSGFDEYCVEAETTGTPESGGIESAMSIPALSTWTSRNISPSLYDWTTGGVPTITLPGAGAFSAASSEILYCPFTFIEGYDYEITLTYDRDVNSGSSNPNSLFFRIYDSSFNTLFSMSEYMSFGVGTVTINFTATGNETQIGVSATSGSNIDLDITDIEGTQTTPLIPEVPGQTLTEQICIDIIEDCESTYIPEDARLLEDGNFRLLE